MTDPSSDDTFDGPMVAGRYRLGPLLGKGSQGATYMARDEQERRTVAVKEFDLGQAVDWKQFELFQRECSVLARLDHPGIPRYLAHFESEDSTRHYLVMEFIAGRSLKDIVAEGGALDEKDLWRILIQMVDILSHLHGHVPPIVHRDIKPANLIQRSNGEIYLVDFGGARTALRTDGGSTVVGTFGYMAPEQLHGQANPPADLYSLGATLLYLGTGIEPEDFPRRGLRIDFQSLYPASEDLAEVLGALLEPDPDDRPPSATDLKALLWPGIDHPSEPPMPAGSPRNRKAPPGHEEPPSATPDLASSPSTAGPLPALAGRIPDSLSLFAGIAMVIVGVLGQVGLWSAAKIVVPLVFALISLLVPPGRRSSLTENRRSLQESMQKARPLFRDLVGRGKIEAGRGYAWLNSSPPSSGARRAAGIRNIPLPPAPPSPPAPPARPASADPASRRRNAARDQLRHWRHQGERPQENPRQWRSIRRQNRQERRQAQEAQPSQHPRRRR